MPGKSTVVEVGRITIRVQEGHATCSGGDGTCKEPGLAGGYNCPFVDDKGRKVDASNPFHPICGFSPSGE